MGLLMASASAKHVVMKMVPTKVVRHKRSHTASMDKLGGARERGGQSREKTVDGELAGDGKEPTTSSGGRWWKAGRDGTVEGICRGGDWRGVELRR